MGMNRRSFLQGAAGAAVFGPAAVKAAAEAAVIGTQATLADVGAAGGYLVPADMARKLANTLLVMSSRGIEATYEYEFEDGRKETETEVMVDAETGDCRFLGEITAGSCNA